MSEIPELEVAARDVEGVVTVSVRGEVDLSTAPRLEAAFSSALGDAETGVVFDLREVSYFGSEGIRTLVSAWSRATALDLPATVLASAIVRRVLGVAGLEEFVAP